MKTELPKQSLAFQSLFSETDGNSEISLRPVYPAMGSSHSDELSAIHKGKSGGKRNSTTSSLATQSKVRIDEISDSEDEAEEPKVTPPIPKMQARYKLGQYVLSMRNQRVYIVKGIVEDLDENTIEMHLHGVNHQETLQVSMNDLNYQVASADNAIWAVSKGLDIYSAEKLKTSMMMSTKVASEEFAQKFAKTTTFLNAGGNITYLFQQFAQIIYEIINGFQVPEDFVILRSLYDEFPEDWKVSSKLAADAIMVTQKFDLKYTKEVMSTNLSLFANANAGGESTGIMYASNGVGRIPFEIFECLLNSLPFNLQDIEKIKEKIKSVYNKILYGNSEMVLYQLQIPDVSLGKLAYPSIDGGKKLGSYKFGTSLVKILERLNNVGMTLNDEDMLEFVDKSQKSLKTCSEQTFYDDQENFERMNYFVFKASKFPQYWDAQDLRRGTQARVIMNPDYFMNPSSNVKVKMHKSPLLESDESLETELLEIKEHSILAALDQIGVPKPDGFQSIITNESDSKKSQLDFEEKKARIEALWKYYVLKRNEVGDSEYIQLIFSITEVLKKLPLNYSSLYKTILTLYADQDVSVRKLKLQSYYNFLIRKLE